MPASLQRSTGFTSIPTNTKVTRDQQTRLYFQADSTLYATAGGEHQFKFGVQADRVGNNVLNGESRNRVSHASGIPGAGVPQRAAPTATTRSAATPWRRTRA